MIHKTFYWPSIVNFFSLRKTLVKYPHLLEIGPDPGQIVTYRSKVKLHGTNAAIVFFKNDVRFLSRHQEVTVKNSNMGFATWAAGLSLSSGEVFEKHADCDAVVVHGEWFGKGIPVKGTIASMVEKHFAVFAVSLYNGDDKKHMICDPSQILVLLSLLENMQQNCTVIPYHTHSVTIDFRKNSDELKTITDEINEQVHKISTCDPFIESKFGLSGPGEGLVYYPLRNDVRAFENLAFKAKTEKFAVVATEPATAQIDIVVNCAKFADLVVTSERLEQALRESTDGLFKRDDVGTFLKHLIKDLEKEVQNELEESSLPKKDAMRSCMLKARNWYLCAGQFKAEKS